ncbi:dynamin family protein [Paenibacillus sp. GD4]|uniref:dynamin family protein n=1 Tax=Paenibacillus sp. GD4 TaxID=3068890 RepID=UPI00279640BD|nr:dynamin family protein [Paenibacillus sp. GD4]MDQ1908950.1 dynamin family protein [Paenibacillus sp. GD4]
MLERYAETKKYLLQFTKELEKCDAIDPYIISNSMLEDELVRLEKGDFKIALVAPFSAGKSTFINSIIGKDLLSMDIRAETSVITKISYAQQIKIEIAYFQHTQVETIETDELGQPLTYETCKAMLSKITTVRDETNEERIKQVVVYCPLEICKDNVEIVDTPGLFSRHEKHEAITNNILPQVNAVIFMIDPNSVGEEHFTEKIRNYVQSAKNSSLEEDGRHIFFVINKIDVFDAEDIAKARHELEEVLSGILRQPNIHEVSAYFGMKGKQLQSGDLSIIDIQKDKKIKIADPSDPEYTIAGRQITEQHVGNIISFSKIKQLEASLGEYLQSKNKYLLTNVISTVRSILSDSLNKLKFEVHEIQASLQQDKTVYIEKIDRLRAEIDSLKVETLQSIQGLVSKRIRGGISGQSLGDEISEEISGYLIDVAKDIERELFKRWSKAKQGIDRYNAEEVVQSVILDAEEYLVLKVKEMVRKSFLTIKSIISTLIGDIQQQLDQVTEKLEEAEMKNLGTKMDRIGNLNVENLVGETMNKIEREFSDILVSIAKDCQDKVQSAYDASTSMVKVKGVWNWFKGLFGAADYEEKFDIYRFKRELDGMMDDLTETMRSKLLESEALICEPIVDMTTDIANDINKEVGKVITNVVKIKQTVLSNLKKEMDKNEDEKKSSVLQKQKNMKKLDEISHRFEQRMSELTEEDKHEFSGQDRVYQSISR